MNQRLLQLLFQQQTIPLPDPAEFTAGFLQLLLRFPQLFPALLHVGVIIRKLFQITLLFLSVADHLLQGISVFSLQMVQNIQTFLHGCKILTVKLTVFHILRYIPIIVRQKAVDLRKLFCKLRKSFVKSRHTSHRPKGPAQGLTGAIVVISGEQPALRKALQNPSAVGHETVLLLQLLVLAGHRRSLLDLLVLKLRKGLFLCPCGLIHGLFLQRSSQATALLIRLPHSRRGRFRLRTAIGVQNFQMLFFLQKGLMLMLTVNIDQRLCQLLHLLRRDSLSVDPADTLPGLKLPADDYLTVLSRLQFQLLQLFYHLRTVRGKNQFHQCALGPLAQHFLLKFPSQRQMNTADEQRLSRTGLTGEDIQPRAEFHLRLLHQRQIFHM